MKKQTISVLIFFAFVFMLAGCRENTAVISATNLPIGGTNGKILTIKTDDTKKQKVVDISGIPGKSVRSKDERFVFTASSNALKNDEITRLDLKTESIKTIPVKSHFLQIRHIWDITISGDGSKLIVGTRNSIYTSCYIEIYDLETMNFVKDFSIKRSNIDYYRIGMKLIANPVKEEIYAMVSGDVIQKVRIRALNFNGDFIGEDQTINADYFDYNYGFNISSNGQLLIGVSDKIYPFKVENSGLKPLNPISEKDGEELTFHGKTNVLFSKDFNVVYITSAGVYIPDSTNLGGSCVVLNVKKILNNDDNPFLTSMVNFVYDDLIKWIAEKLKVPMMDLIDETNMYGIADSYISGNTCYMIIASVAGLGTDVSGLSKGKYILSAFETMPLGGQIWIGGKVLDKYPSSINVNKANDTIVLTNRWNKSVTILKKKPTWLTPSAEEIKLDAIEEMNKDLYPSGATIGSVEINK